MKPSHLAGHFWLKFNPNRADNSPALVRSAAGVVEGAWNLTAMAQMNWIF